ncbi:ribonuclease HI family protein [Patescibacteria group bacterium]|nr:ribonuclease HI family protein [Patescibacteria group bacterium]MBU0776713.1 ribonuclease HI family protein [Patescibacteria group bacterium]MBU0846157.1 ribonuclease HI family protein [Patescibacteria group bacterium]MBU0922754.1 ribonuclease HI family protein [Patescibacteria group bacterium]MBU1066271.1 ribonuclease HI family protein [Patescibacteria group bacterium]
MEDKIIIYCDGGARGNPGPAASAFVAIQDGKITHRGSKYIGIATNNVAEYGSVLLALSWLFKNYKDDTDLEIIINLDSELVTKQMSGLYKVKNPKLKEMFVKGKGIESKLSSKVIYKWTPRDKNRLADFLVNKELDKRI